MQTRVQQNVNRGLPTSREGECEVILLEKGSREPFDTGWKPWGHDSAEDVSHSVPPRVSPTQSTQPVPSDDCGWKTCPVPTSQSSSWTDEKRKSG